MSTSRQVEGYGLRSSECRFYRKLKNQIFLSRGVTASRQVDGYGMLSSEFRFNRTTASRQVDGYGILFSELHFYRMTASRQVDGYGMLFSGLHFYRTPFWIKNFEFPRRWFNQIPGRPFWKKFKSC